MNIITLLSNLYTNRKSDWIMTLEDTEIQPFVIQRWLAMNDSIRVQTRWLDKYTFHLPPKMYLSLAWSILPKTPKAPFVKYIKQVADENEYDFIIPKIRKHLQLADNDYNAMKGRIIEAIEKDKVSWFREYGVPKKYWKQHYLNFKQIKESNKPEPVKQQGLGAWGL